MSDLTDIYDKQMERTVALSSMIFEHKQSHQIAREREKSAWEMFAALSISTILVAMSHSTKNKMLAVPIAPMLMWAGYRVNSCFFYNNDAIREEARKILQDRNKIKFVGAPITLKELDERIAAKAKL